jgi:hypothetical protein
MTKGSSMANRLGPICAIMVMAFLIGVNLSNTEADAYSLSKIPFPEGTYIIPMDGKQTDILKAYGFAHALLRNSTGVFRLIQPPNVNLTTELYGNALFEGGPFMVWKESGPIVEQVKTSFPTVTLDRLQSIHVSANVLVVDEPTNILIIKGAYNWGETEDLLNDMNIPYDLMDYAVLESSASSISILKQYNLVVDDCSGWNGNIQEEMIFAFQTYVEDGGNLVFTDRAILEAVKIFPGYVTTAGSLKGSWSSHVIQTGEPPSQYWGSTEISIYTELNGIVIETVGEGASALLYSSEYGIHQRILAAYFYYGDGLVELFAYHPKEQKIHSHLTYIYASALYGNLFIGGKTTLPPPSPSNQVPLVVPPPAVPPPPPPPPSIPIAVALPAGYLYAGALPLGLIAVLKSKLRLKLKRKIAVRAK